VPLRAIAALPDELRELAVRDGRAVDEERPRLDLVRHELVVVRPRLVGRAEDERAALDRDLVGSRGRAVGRRLVGRGVLGARLQLERLRDQLLVLELVLDDEAEDEALPQERVRRVEIDVVDEVKRALADVVGVRARRPGTQEREVAPLAPLVTERVVDLVVQLGRRRLAVQVAQEPQLLEVRRVGKVPHDRRDERGGLADEVGLGDRLEQLHGGGPDTFERRAYLDARVHCSDSASGTAVSPG
jgi:hypothetical protein